MTIANKFPLGSGAGGILGPKQTLEDMYVRYCIEPVSYTHLDVYKRQAYIGVSTSVSALACPYCGSTNIDTGNQIVYTCLDCQSEDKPSSFSTIVINKEIARKISLSLIHI